MDVTFRGKQLEAAVVATAKNFFGRCDRFDRVFPTVAWWYWESGRKVFFKDKERSLKKREVRMLPWELLKALKCLLPHRKRASFNVSGADQCIWVRFWSIEPAVLHIEPAHLCESQTVTGLPSKSSFAASSIKDLDWCASQNILERCVSLFETRSPQEPENSCPRVHTPYQWGKDPDDIVKRLIQTIV